MQKTLKKIISIMLVILMCVSAAPLDGLVGLDFGLTASAATTGSLGGSITYTLDGSSLTISGSGYMDGYGYSDSPFYNNSDIRSVTIKSGVKNIGSYLFVKCTSLKYLYFEDNYDGVESVGKMAFSGCTSLRDVSLPYSTTFIDQYAFSGCRNLETVDAGNAEQINGGTYDGCEILNELYYTNKLNYIRTDGLPDSYFTSRSFRIYFEGSNDDWENVNVDDYNEDGRLGIATKDQVRDSVVTDGEDQPDDCPTNSDRQGTIGDDVTWRVDYDMEIYIEGTGDTYDYSGGTPISIYDTGNNEYLYVSDGVTSVGNYLFDGLRTIESIDLADSVTKVGKYAFRDCTSVRGVWIGKGLKTIPGNAFSGMWSLEKIVLNSENPYLALVDEVLFTKDMKTLIHYPCFRDGWEYTIPSGVTKLDDNAFEDTNFGTLNIPESVTTLGNTTFDGMYDLQDIYFGGTESQWNALWATGSNNNINGATVHFAKKDYDGQLGDNVYYYFDKTTGAVEIVGTGDMYDYTDSNTFPLFKNYNVKSVTIGEGVTSVGDYLFSGCDELTSVTLPSTLKKIGEYAFRDCRFESLTIPGKVETIGGYAFSECTNLATITISNGVKTIGDYAFLDCGALKNITFPESLESIGDYVFNNCYDLTAINVDANNKNFASVDGVLFNKDKTTLIRYPQVKAGESYSVPESVTTIADMAFYQASNLKSITMTNNVKTLGAFAFMYCTKLENITLSNQITTIPDGAFALTAFKSFTIPSGVTTIGDAAFYYCSALADVYYGATEDSWNKIDIGSGNDPLTNATRHYVQRGQIGENVFYTFDLTSGEVTVTGTGKMYNFSAFSSSKTPFYQNKNVKSVTIDEGVENIGSYLFYWCSNLDSLTIPSTVKEIRFDAFYKCKLTTLVIPGNVETIGDSAFRSCKITNLTISDGVKAIAEQAFDNNDNLETVNIPKSVESIGKYAFADCDNLQSITVDTDNEYYTAVDGVLFNKAMTELIQYPATKTTENYTVPESVKTIADIAFSENKNIKSVTMADNVETIGEYVFANCDKLESVKLSNKLTAIPENAFKDCSALTSIVIPEGVTTIGQSAFRDCTSLKTVTIPSTLTSIGNEAFSYEAFSYEAYYRYMTLELDTVYYSGCVGQKANFDAIAFGEYNECIQNANLIYADHAFVDVQSKAATCTESGNDAYKYCSKCEQYFAADADVKSTDGLATNESYLTGEALGHNFTDVPFKEATCTEDGNEAYKYCSVCDKYFDTTAEKFDTNGADDNSAYIITATGHNFNEIETGCAPDCCNDGIDSYKTCSNCCKFFAADADKFSTDSEESYVAFIQTATGHFFGDIVEPKPATCTEDGVKIAYKYCEKCKYYYDASAGYTEIFGQGAETPSLFIEKAHGHNFTDVPYKAAGCTDSGNEAYKYCEACNKYFDTSAGKDATNGADTNSAYIIVATGHDFTGAIKMDTDGKDGKHSYACVNGCGEYGNAAAHVWDGGKATTAATHLKDGETTYTCSCGATYTTPIAKLKDHTYTTEVVDPTCTEQGYVLHKCACGDSYKDTYVDATGHSYENGTCTSCGDKDPNYTGDQGGSTGDNTSDCDCICHCSSKFVQFFYKIIRWFWKIFKIHKTCDCGVIHY